MNALKARKKYDQEQMIMAYKQRQKEEAEKIAKMSLEEKAAYEAEKKEQQRRLKDILMLPSFVDALNGPYMKGI